MLALAGIVQSAKRKFPCGGFAVYLGAKPRAPALRSALLCFVFRLIAAGPFRAPSYSDNALRIAAQACIYKGKPYLWQKKNFLK
jgi:hypothetical protein